jgi:hypothetical protein
MTNKIYIKSSKSYETMQEQARLLLEGKIEDDGDDEVLDIAILMAYKNDLDVLFIRYDKEITPETAYNIRYGNGYRIRPSL